MSRYLSRTNSCRSGFDAVRRLTIAIAFSAVWFAGSVRALERSPPLPVKDCEASTAAEMKRYTEIIEHTEETFELLPIPGGTFTMGSPQEEADRTEAEGPQRQVTVSPFWMSKCEVTWDVYDIWMSDIDLFRRETFRLSLTPRDNLADKFQISQPTKPYTDMTFGMGMRGYPAVCMTQHSARVFCNWLTQKTGRYYRLPTEAEWEYACRAGTDAAYSFGDDARQLEEYAWYEDNTDEGYRKVGRKKPNPWGLHDMHGNVAEWVLDQYTENGYGSNSVEPLVDPLVVPQTLYPRVVRGGSWDQPANELRSAARQGSEIDWIQQDPQVPVSIWYLTDALHVGFRVVRPLNEPSENDRLTKWEKSEPVQVERPHPKQE